MFTVQATYVVHTFALLIFRRWPHQSQLYWSHEKPITYFSSSESFPVTATVCIPRDISLSTLFSVNKDNNLIFSCVWKLASFLLSTNYKTLRSSISPFISSTLVYYLGKIKCFHIVIKLIRNHSISMTLLTSF